MRICHRKCIAAIFRDFCGILPGFYSPNHKSQLCTFALDFSLADECRSDKSMQHRPESRKHGFARSHTRGKLRSFSVFLSFSMRRKHHPLFCLSPQDLLSLGIVCSGGLLSLSANYGKVNYSGANYEKKASHNSQFAFYLQFPFPKIGNQRNPTVNEYKL